MKKLFLLVSSFFLTSPVLVWAQEFTTELGGVRDAVGYDETISLADIIGQLIKIGLSVLGVILLVLVIYAGFLWMTAGGETAKVEKAKSFMLNAVIGLVIILAAYAVTEFVILSLAGAGLTG